jgi:DNA-binding response OmpR family regulator
MKTIFVMLCPDCNRKQHTNSQLLVLSSQALWRGQDLLLTPAELRILTLLAGNAGAYFSYRQIYDVVQTPGFHAGAGPEGYKINTRGLIKRLRRKFECVDPSFSSIRCSTGFGYSWREEIPKEMSDGRETRRTRIRRISPMVRGQVADAEEAD